MRPRPRLRELLKKKNCKTDPVKCDYNFASRSGVLVRALASHQCGPGLIPGPGVICRLSLLLVLIFALRVFLWGLWFFSLYKKQHFQIPIQSGSSERRATLWSPLKFLFIFFIYFICYLFIILGRTIIVETSLTTSQQHKVFF